MKIIKKNQLTILVLALMLVTAGYLNYNSSIQTSTEVASIGDATLVSSNMSNSINSVIPDEERSDNSRITKNEDKKEEVNNSVVTKEETIQTNSEASSNSEYFTSTRLERDTMYSQMLESYQKILDSTTTSEKQKDAAQKEIAKINQVKNSIMICENLIKTKGINNVVMLVNDDSISVVVDKDEIKKEDIAQIQSIIARELNVKINDIHIMNRT